MFDQMSKKGPSLRLPLIALCAVIIGMLMSNTVLSLSPLGGFALIFGAAILIVLAIELTAFFRRRRKTPPNRRPHFLWSYFEERQQRRRRKSVPEEIDTEIAESYQGTWVQ